MGQLSSRDIVTLYMTDSGGTNGANFEQDFLAQEFVRAQIGGTWYILSDPLLWKVTEKLIFTNGHWQDNGSILAPGN